MTVLLFHVDAPFMAGGYLGVDVFFVISGFLVTKIIWDDVVHGDMSLSDFYIRRVRRLLPASLATIFVSLAVGSFLFSTSDLSDFGKSAIAALLFVPNIFFWLQSGYFDTEAIQKPLLHYWSLGVEEQFYLAWPALLIVVGLVGRKAVILLIGLIFLVSLLAAQTYEDPTAVFFLTPFRAFEFAAGALLSFAPRLPLRFASVAYAVGLAMILVSCVLLEGTYPGFVSLVPVAGAVFCLAGGYTGLGQRLAVRPVTFIGDISYSLYLVHWPIVVFYRYTTHAELIPIEQIGLVLTSLVAGYALYAFVERPLRNAQWWSRGRAILAGTTLVATLGAASTVWATNGLAWRVPEELRTATNSLEFYKDEREKLGTRHARALKRMNGVSPIVVIGDSHGLDFTLALYQNGVVAKFHNIAYSCQPVVGPRPAGKKHDAAEQTRRCNSSMAKILNSQSVRDAKEIILAPRWTDWSAEQIPGAVDALRKVSGAKIDIIGNGVEYQQTVTSLVQKYGRRDGIDEYAKMAEKPNERAAKIKALATASGAEFVDKKLVLCGDLCPIFVPGTDNLTMWDSNHLTAAGAKYFGSQLLATLPEIAMK